MKLPGTKSDVGQASEHLVASDLLARGFRVTKPLNTNGHHDLHAHIGGEWRTFQVKAGRRNSVTGAIINTENRKSRPILSDIVAVVWLPTKEIRYIPANIQQLPAELAHTTNGPLDAEK